MASFSGIVPVTDQNQQGFFDPVIKPIAQGVGAVFGVFTSAIANLEVIKSSPTALSKAIKLTGYAGSAVSMMTGRANAFSKLADFYGHTDALIDASYLFEDAPYFIKGIIGDFFDTKENSITHSFGRCALLAADLGGWALWLETLGLVTLASTSTAVAVTGAAVTLAFLCLGLDAYNKLYSTTKWDSKTNSNVVKTEDDFTKNKYSLAHAVSEVALHGTQVFGRAFKAVGNMPAYKPFVVVTGVLAAIFGIGGRLHDANVDNNIKKVN